MGQPAIFFIWLTVVFLIIPRAPTIIGMMLVLKYHILPGLCIYLFHYILWLNVIYLLAQTYQLKVIFFFYSPYPLYQSMALYSSINLDSKVFENSRSFWLQLLALVGVYIIIIIIIITPCELFTPALTDGLSLE